MTNKERYTAIRKAQFRVMNEWLKAKKELNLEDLTLYDLITGGFNNASKIVR